MIKNILLSALLVLFLISCNSNDPLGPEDFNNENFSYILYGDLPTSILIPISQELNGNHTRITNDLGVENMPRVSLLLWADEEEFQADMRIRIGTNYPGATGYVTGDNEICMLNVGNLPLTAVHEFAHLVSLQVNPYIANNPRWLWESIALYESRDFVDPKTLNYMVNGDYPTLSELNTDYNLSNHQIYDVGYTILEYIIETWSVDHVISLIEENGNISAVLGLSSSDFEKGWYQFVKYKYL